MAAFVHKQHNVTMLCYHIVTVVKYRKPLINGGIDEDIRTMCHHIENAYDIQFIEVGMENDHVHWLVQSVPTYSVTKIVTIIKSLTARHIRANNENVRNELHNGTFWTSGYFAATVHRDVAEETMKKYIADQGGGRGYRRVMHDGDMAKYMTWRQSENGGRQTK